eukprot:2542827-Amphidinium_carterae.1
MKPQRVQELRELIAKVLSMNVLPLRLLRQLTGKVESFASLLFAWRPFANELHAAIHDEMARRTAPMNCCWTDQVRPALSWFTSFLTEANGHIERDYLYTAFNKRDQLVILTDASPWGVGGLLVQHGRIKSWFTSQISELDASILQL